MHSLGAYFLSRDFGDGKRCWNHGQHSYALVRFLTDSFRNSFVKNHLNFFKSILGCARILSEIFMSHNQSRKRPLQTRAHELIHPRTTLNNVELAFFTQVSRSLSKTFEDPKLKSKLRKWNAVDKSYLIWDLGRAMNYVRVTHMGISTMERLRFKCRAFHVPNLMHKLRLNLFLTDKHFESL